MAKLQVAEQQFDLDLDFFLCPVHGLFAPGRFDAEWTTEEGCPVLMPDEEDCDEALTPVFLGHLLELA